MTVSAHHMNCRLECQHCDPSSGPYLSPEPLLERPRWVRAELEDGYPVSAYAYGRSNPVQNTDKDGNYPAGSGVSSRFCVKCDAMPRVNPEFCIFDRGSKDENCERAKEVARDLCSDSASPSNRSVCPCARTLALNLCDIFHTRGDACSQF